MPFFPRFKNSFYIFRKKTTGINFFSGGGERHKNFFPFFGKGPDNFSNLKLFFFLSKKENPSEGFLFGNDEKRETKKNFLQEIIIRNCETIPENNLCKIFEDLFYQEFFSKNKVEKISKFINNWYQINNDRFSKVKKMNISKNKEKIFFFFQTYEPKVKSLKIISNTYSEKNTVPFIKKIRTKLFSILLGVSFGKMLKFDLNLLNRIRSLDGVKSIDFSIKDQNLGDYGDFLDVTIKLEKTRSMAIEPEVTLINNQLSSSVSFLENNLLGTGISLKQKIFFKKFNPYYMRFELDNTNLRQLKRFQLFGKYLKNCFSFGSVLKYFPTDNKNVYVKLGLGLELCFKKNFFLNSFFSNSITPFQFSSSFSSVRDLKDHCFISYISVEKFSKTVDTKCSTIFNSKIKPLADNSGTNGIIIFIENRFSAYTSEKFEEGCEKDSLFQYKNKRVLTGFSEKSVSLNTLISKNLKLLLTMKFLYPPEKPLSCHKKIELRCELGKLISFSWNFSNFGKIRATMG